MIFTGIPYAIMMSQRLGRCSESKAFSKSIKLRTRGVCHSYDCSIMLRKMNICSVVLLPCRNPACSALSLLSAPLFKRSIRILSNTLPAITRSVIPRQFVHSFKLPFFGSLTISPFNHSYGITSFSLIIWMISCNFCVVVLMSTFNNSATMLWTPAAFPFFRELICILDFSFADWSGAYLLDLRNFVSSYHYWVRRWWSIDDLFKMFFPSSKPAGVVCDGLSALVVNSGVLVSSFIAYGLCFLAFMFPISAACCASSIRLLSHSLLSHFKLFFTSLSLLLCFARSCCWILSDLAFSALPLSCFRSSTFAHDSVYYISFSYPIHSLLYCYRLC